MKTLKAILQDINDLPDEGGGFCRDCADDGPFCPTRGMPCSLTVDDLKALARAALADPQPSAWVEIRSEGLPPDGKYYQCSCRRTDGSNEDAVWDLRLEDGRWTDDNERGYDINDHWIVLAWRPLPAPFTPGTVTQEVSPDWETDIRLGGIEKTIAKLESADTPSVEGKEADETLEQDKTAD